jgi:serine/threonine protein kinase
MYACYPKFVVEQVDELIRRMHHEGGAIHADLRHVNIVLCPPSGTKGCNSVSVRLIDFGMSRWIDKLTTSDEKSIIHHYMTHLDDGSLSLSDATTLDKEFYKSHLLKFHHQLLLADDE